MKDKPMNKQFKNRHFIRKCKALIRISLFSLYAAVAFNPDSSIAAPSGKLEDWRFSPQGSQLEISLSTPSRFEYFDLSEPRQYQSVGGELPLGATAQLPPGAYSPSQSLKAPYTPQPPGMVPVQPSGVLPPLQPAGVLPPGAYINPSQLPAQITPQLPSQFPSQLPPGINTPSSSLTAPLPLTPIRNGNTGQPTITVPPITTIDSSRQIPNWDLPPAEFPSPSGNLNSSPSFFPTPKQIQ